MNAFRVMALGASLFVMSNAALAQDGAQPVAVHSPASASIIPAGLSVPMTMNAGISSSRSEVGETIALTVSTDVISNGIVVIPRGTRVVGEVTMRSGRGVFGKSGKMEIAFRYIDMEGVRVPLRGSHFQAGNGNTAATVGAVVAAGVVGGLVVTGRSANITEGTEFQAVTIDDLPVEILPASNGYDRPRARLASSYAPSPVLTGSPRQQEEQRLAEERRAERTARRRAR